MMKKNDFVSFAIEAHGDQKYGLYAYKVHLAAVERVLADFGYCSRFWRAVAWLHDTMEDTSVCHEDLKRAFSTKVAETVYAVSGFGENRTEKQSNIRKKIEGNRDACILKVADRIANVEFAVKTQSQHQVTYLEEWYAFERAVRESVPTMMIDRLNRAYARCVA